MILMTNLDCIVCGTPLNEDEAFFSKKKSMNVVFCEDHKDYCENCDVQSCNIDNCPLYKENLTKC
ncbi:MAG: hypothetical protein ABEK17_03305 [Candidatus Aenigmatarchaeota archaeon]